MFSRYAFTINDIFWLSSHNHLPDSAEIDLPSYLVEADRVRKKEWREYIQDTLAAKFGVRPVKFGYYRPAPRA